MESYIMENIIEVWETAAYYLLKIFWMESINEAARKHIEFLKRTEYLIDGLVSHYQIDFRKFMKGA
jgi:hypothetical protein